VFALHAAAIGALVRKWVAPCSPSRRPLLPPPAAAAAHLCSVPLLQVVLAAGQPLRVMIAGAPAAGKGTQCAKIVDKVRP